MNKITSALLAALLLTAPAAVLPGSPEPPVRADGTYTGSHSFVTVAVTIADGKIAAIIITEHGGGGDHYADLIRPLADRMLEKQTTDVDTVTGATVSSNHLKKAVAKALKKAEIK